MTPAPFAGNGWSAGRAWSQVPASRVAVASDPVPHRRPECFTHLFHFRSWVQSSQVDQLDTIRSARKLCEAAMWMNVALRRSPRKVLAVMGEECKVERIDTSPQDKHLYT